MSNNKIILTLTPENEKWIAEMIDDGFDFKKIFKNKPILGISAETLDGPIAGLAVHSVNKVTSDQIPEEYQDELNAAIADLSDGDKDYTEAANQVFSILDQCADKIKNLSEKVKNMIHVFLYYIRTAVCAYLEKVALE